MKSKIIIVILCVLAVELGILNYQTASRTKGGAAKAPSDISTGQTLDDNAGREANVIKDPPEVQKSTENPGAGSPPVSVADDRDKGTVPDTQKKPPSAEEEYMSLIELGLMATKVLDEPDTPKAVDAIRPSIVRLRTGALIGSGIIVRIERDTAIIASNKHQLSASKYSSITFFDGRRVSGTRAFVASEYDLGFLEADISRIPFEFRKNLRTILYDRDFKISEGDDIFLAASADGVAANVTEGKVADPMYYFPEFGSYMVYAHCRAKPGMSGGGAFDPRGRCVGMITGGEGEDTASLPVEFVINELEAHYGKKD